MRKRNVQILFRLTEEEAEHRINQLAVKANALGFVDTPMLREEARKWHEFQIDIRKRYLLPHRSS